MTGGFIMDEAGKKLREQQERLERLRYVQFNRQDKLDSSKNIIMRAVQQEYPDIDRQQAEKVTRELVLAPKKASIKIGNKEVPVADLQFQIALTIESLGSETSSEEEYFSWFSESSEIIQHMNDGFVSEDDLAERNDWLEDSYSREAEIMTCLGLFQNCAFPEAKKHYTNLYNKLVKLRQIRSSIKESTANRADKPQEIDHKKKENDYKKAVVYVAAMREFMKRKPRWNMPKRTLQKLSMYHGEDDDLDDDYEEFYGMYEDEEMRRREEQEMLAQDDNVNGIDLVFRFDDHLKEDILFHWDDDRFQAYERSLAEEFIERAEPEQPAVESAEDVREHIARLSGRRPPMKSRPLSYSMDRTRAFDGAYYNRLSARLQNA